MVAPLGRSCALLGAFQSFTRVVIVSVAVTRCHGNGEPAPVTNASACASVSVLAFRRGRWKERMDHGRPETTMRRRRLNI